jgi:protein gp37
MAENSAIAWTDHTFNPWMGCTKVSAGCAHCYAEQLMDIRYGKASWGPNGTRNRTSVGTWGTVRTLDKRAGERGVRERIFCASLADVFEDHPLIRDETRGDLWFLIKKCRNLDWLLLTKRPENICVMLERFLGVDWIKQLNGDFSHVMFGTSVENQLEADRRIPLLLEVPARRFLSIEPLLHSVNLRSVDRNDGWAIDSLAGIYSRHHDEYDEGFDHPPAIEVHDEGPSIHWVIVGGESGQHCRPMDIEWARAIRDQCKTARVPFFMKQLGGYPDKRELLDDFPEDLRIREFPAFSQAGA